MITATRTMMGSVLGQLRHTYRFSAVPVLYHENVAEHGYWTAVIGMAIIEDLKGTDVFDEFDDPEMFMGIVAMKALVHDIEESMTGDIVRDLKYATPEIRSSIAAVEGQFVDQLLQGMGEGATTFKSLWERSKDGTFTGNVVALADLLCVISYCDHEVELGNKSPKVFTIRKECMKLIRNKFIHTNLSPFVTEWLRRREPRAR